MICRCFMAFDPEKVKYKRNMNMKDLPPHQILEDGSRCCAWCDKPVPQRRRSWCSDECVNEFLIRSNAKHALEKLIERDGYKCEICGIDPTELQAQAFIPHPKMANFNDQHFALVRFEIAMEEYVAKLPAMRAVRDQYPWLRSNRRTLEIDHIKPVSEGGGCCGLDNLRLLCPGCHAKESGKLRSRLNAVNREKYGTAYPGYKIMRGILS